MNVNFINMNGFSEEKLKDLFESFVGKEMVSISENSETYGMGVNSYHYYSGILEKNVFKSYGVENHFTEESLKRFNIVGEKGGIILDTPAHPICGDDFGFHLFSNNYFNETDETFLWIVDNNVYYISLDDLDIQKYFTNINLIFNLGFDTPFNNQQLHPYYHKVFLNSFSTTFLDLRYYDELHGNDGLDRIFENYKTLQQISYS